MRLSRWLSRCIFPPKKNIIRCNIYICVTEQQQQQQLSFILVFTWFEQNCELEISQFFLQPRERNKNVIDSIVVIYFITYIHSSLFQVFCFIILLAPSFTNALFFLTTPYSGKISGQVKLPLFVKWYNIIILSSISARQLMDFLHQYNY